MKCFSLLEYTFGLVKIVKKMKKFLGVFTKLRFGVNAAVRMRKSLISDYN